MTPRSPLARAVGLFASDESGGPAVEFAMIAPIAIALIMLAVNMGFLMYAGATLNFATQDAARCGAVNFGIAGTSCVDAASTESYAVSRYKGPAIDPDFTSDFSNPVCSQVSATATYSFNLGIASGSVPLSASACYPRQPTA